MLQHAQQAIYKLQGSSLRNVFISHVNGTVPYVSFPQTIVRGSAFNRGLNK